MVLPWLIALVLVVITVIIHYEALRVLAAHVQELRLPFRVRLRMVLVMLAIFAAHIFEVLIFALGLYLAQNLFGVGGLGGQVADNSFRDFIYFSSVSYTTLGFGDIYPTGGLRLITGIEALTGLLMITWSASFTFLYMEKFWHLGHSHARKDQVVNVSDK